MAIGDKKASEEAAATTLLGGEFWAGVQAGKDVKISATQLVDYLKTNAVQPTRDELLALVAAQAKQIRKLKMQIFLG